MRGPFLSIDGGLLGKIREGMLFFEKNPDWILQRRESNILLVLWEWNNSAKLHISVSRMGFCVRSYDGVHTACGRYLPPLLESIKSDFRRRYPMKRDPTTLFPKAEPNRDRSERLA